MRETEARLCAKAVESGGGRGPRGRSVVSMRPGWLQSSCLGRAWLVKGVKIPAQGVDASVSLEWWLAQSCIDSRRASPNGEILQGRVTQGDQLPHVSDGIAARNLIESCVGELEDQKPVAWHAREFLVDQAPSTRGVVRVLSRAMMVVVDCIGGFCQTTLLLLAVVQLAPLAPGDLFMVAGFRRRGNVVSMHDATGGSNTEQRVG